MSKPVERDQKSTQVASEKNENPERNARSGFFTLKRGRMEIAFQVTVVVAAILAIATTVVAVSSINDKFSISLWLGFAAAVFILLGGTLSWQKYHWEAEARAKERTPSPKVTEPETPKVAPVEKTGQPFAIKWSGAFETNERTFAVNLWLLHRTTLGCTVSPIHKLVVLRITNLQPVESVIETYSMEAQSADGTWVKLVRIDASDGRVYGLDPKRGFQAAKVLKLDTLDSKIGAKRMITPNETVDGIVLFELPQSIAKEAQFRFYIKDFGGAEMTVTIDPKVKKWDFGQPWSITAEETVDLSKCAVRFYSEASRQ